MWWFLFMYLLVSYIAMYFAINFDPMGGEGGQPRLIENDEVTVESTREAWWVSLIPMINIYIIVVGIYLRIPKIKKSILLRIKKMIEEVENE